MLTSLCILAVANPALPWFTRVCEFFRQGGLFMIPLLACSVIAVTVTIMRAVALRRHLIIPEELEKEIERLQPHDTPESVVRLSRLVRNDTSTLARIAQAGINNLQLPKEENMNAVQTTARHEIVQMERGLHILEIIIGIAPLIGLLGAVSGLVAVFGAFGDSQTAQDPRMIAAGIAEALSTTVVGIGIAIPSLIAHGLLIKKVEQMAADMELLMSGLIAKCYNQKNRRSVPVPSVSEFEQEDPQ
ncbi:MAG: biopolymer transport protein ExbB [Verrucomicrobiota bacterium]|jgi:biopolymer transport protein ExbB